MVAPTSPPTPLDRLLDRLATNRCDSCGRQDVPTPRQVAERFKVSESTIRRLADPAAAPPSATVLGKIAAGLDMTWVALAARLWPDERTSALAGFEEPSA